MIETITSQPAVRHHPVRGCLWGALLGTGISLYLLTFALVPFGSWFALGAPIAAGIIGGAGWGRFGAVRRRKAKAARSRMSRRHRSKVNESISTSDVFSFADPAMRAALQEALDDIEADKRRASAPVVSAPATPAAATTTPPRPQPHPDPETRPDPEPQPSAPEAAEGAQIETVDSIEAAMAAHLDEVMAPVESATSPRFTEPAPDEQVAPEAAPVDFRAGQLPNFVSASDDFDDALAAAAAWVNAATS